MSPLGTRPLDGDVPVIDRRRAEAYLRAGLWREERVADLLREARLRHPDRLAVVSGTTRLTHGELHTAVTAAGRRLEGLGVRAGDRVVVQLPNRAEFVVLVLALLDIGAERRQPPTSITRTPTWRTRSGTRPTFPGTSCITARTIPGCKK